MLDVIIVVILSPTVMMIFIYVLWRIRQRQRRKQDIAPQQVVGSLATKIFFESKRQENEPQECAICLEDYADEDELRILPCKHEFHITCIDSWLTTRKKFVCILINAIKCKRYEIKNFFFKFFVSVQSVNVIFVYRLRKLPYYQTMNLHRNYRRRCYINILQ